MGISQEEKKLFVSRQAGIAGKVLLTTLRSATDSPRGTASSGHL